MSIDLSALVIALFHEHKQRTGHDCTAPLSYRQVLPLALRCDVCLYLDKLMRQAEASQYEPARDGGAACP